MPNPSYLIKNSAVKNNYFTASASGVISAGVQPNLAGSTMVGPADSSLQAADYGISSARKTTIYTGYDNTQVMLGTTNTMRGSANTTVQSPAGYGRFSIQKWNQLRTRRVASAVASGEWNPVTGRFGSTPVNANDFSNIGTDDQAVETRANPSKLAWVYGVATGADYPVKTQ